MKKFSNVDVLAALEAIMKQNTAFYQSDFEIDRKMLTKAARGDDPNGKNFVWLSRAGGTQCSSERMVLMAGTPEHKTWRYYADQSQDRFLAYAVELSGIESGKVRGDLYELDYPQYAAYIEKVADPVESVRVTYPDEPTEIIPYQKFRGMVKYRFQDAEIFYESAHPDVLQSLLSLQHNKRVMEGQPADLASHIQDLNDSLIFNEASYLASQIAKYEKPNSLDGAFFVAEISPYVTPLADSNTYNRLLTMLPYKSEGKQISYDSERDTFYLYVHKDENRDQPVKRLPTPKKSIKSQLKETAPKREAAAIKKKEKEMEL